ncbi:MAG: sulfatase-like hydrolase/transferase [Lentisphaeria bacterium]|nr:sulfatase-like hydrolase/transferase [Lentisphaeria bacterium]NQZ68385.1 sulfatase-like hydrolase/transferase [Lentisphaeria bacterium]
MNIVFIMADQLAAASLGCYGSGVASTPVLDALAERGLRFDRCYATSPVCSPSRATFLTGRSPSIHGVIWNNFQHPRDMPSYAHVLQQHGYHTGGFGKFHDAPMTVPLKENVKYLGFDESVISDDTRWGAYTDWIKTEHPEHYETAIAFCRPYPPLCEAMTEAECQRDALQKKRAEILLPLQKASGFSAMYTSPLPPEIHQSRFITNSALDYMQGRMDAKNEQPFFCLVSYVDPHDPYDPPEPYASMFDPDDMPDPIPATWPADNCATLEKCRQDFGFDAISENLPMIRKLRSLFHGSLKLLDEQVGRIVDFLEANDLTDDTMIIFTTDHGEMLGDHQLLSKGYKPYDSAIRCPLLVSGPGIKPNVSNELVCTLDFFPSICDFANVPADLRPPLEGKTFAGECRGETKEEKWDDVLVAFNLMQTIVSGDGFRLTLFDGDPCGQLFDLNKDPDEQRNLFNDSDYTDKKVTCLVALAAAQNRPALIPQYRNLPVVDGKRTCSDGPEKLHLTEKFPDFDLKK